MRYFDVFSMLEYCLLWLCVMFPHKTNCTLVHDGLRGINFKNNCRISSSKLSSVRTTTNINVLMFQNVILALKALIIRAPTVKSSHQEHYSQIQCSVTGRRIISTVMKLLFHKYSLCMALLVSSLAPCNVNCVQCNAILKLF